MLLSGRAFALQLTGTGFDPQRHHFFPLLFFISEFPFPSFFLFPLIMLKHEKVYVLQQFQKIPEKPGSNNPFSLNGLKSCIFVHYRQSLLQFCWPALEKSVCITNSSFKEIIQIDHSQEINLFTLRRISFLKIIHVNLWHHMQLFNCLRLVYYQYLVMHHLFND